jgi:hypothetical protein
VSGVKLGGRESDLTIPECGLAIMQQTSSTRNWIEPLTDKRVHDCPPHTPERIMQRDGGAGTHAQSTALALGHRDQDRRTMAPGDAVARNETTDPACKHRLQKLRG